MKQSLGLLLFLHDFLKFSFDIIIQTHLISEFPGVEYYFLLALFLFLLSCIFFLVILVFIPLSFVFFLILFVVLSWLKLHIDVDNLISEH